MTPQFHASLINDPFGDPGLYVDFLFQRRAIMFDIGTIAQVPTRKLLRVSHVFVSHCHIDHFIGFDHLLRLSLGRDKLLHLFGPPGFTSQVEHRLASYTWNLVYSYETDFTVVATELLPTGEACRAEFHCRHQFRREGESTLTIDDGLLLDEEELRVRATFLDHKVPCLAFALEEKAHVNVHKSRLEALGLPTGPWLQELKKAVLKDEPDAFPIRVWWRDGDSVRERFIPLGTLRNEVLRVVAGQKIAYVTDVGLTPQNAGRIVELAHGADYLFIEATFMHQDAERALDRSHLTARQAGELARRAGAERVIPFHFSPRYLDRENSLRDEVVQAFAGLQRATDVDFLPPDDV